MEVNSTHEKERERERDREREREREREIERELSFLPLCPLGGAQFGGIG